MALRCYREAIRAWFAADDDGARAQRLRDRLAPELHVFLGDDEACADHMPAEPDFVVWACPVARYGAAGAGADAAFLPLCRAYLNCSAAALKEDNAPFSVWCAAMAAECAQLAGSGLLPKALLRRLVALMALGRFAQVRLDGDHLLSWPLPDPAREAVQVLVRRAHTVSAAAPAGGANHALSPATLGCAPLRLCWRRPLPRRVAAGTRVRVGLFLHTEFGLFQRDPAFADQRVTVTATSESGTSGGGSAAVADVSAAAPRLGPAGRTWLDVELDGQPGSSVRLVAHLAASGADGPGGGQGERDPVSRLLGPPSWSALASRRIAPAWSAPVLLTAPGEERQDSALDEDEGKGDVASHARVLRRLWPAALPPLLVAETDGDLGIGGRLWDGALHAMSLLRCAPALVAGRRVVELGCGTGTLSLACLAAGASHVIATDLPEVVAGAEANADLNRAVRGAASGDWTAQALAWGSDDADSLPWVPDVVIAADVVYDPALYAPLRHTLRRVCGPRTVVLLAHRCRNERDDEFFLPWSRDEFHVARLERVAGGGVPSGPGTRSAICSAEEGSLSRLRALLLGDGPPEAREAVCARLGAAWRFAADLDLFVAVARGEGEISP